ncbi:hypothetical protein ABZ656_40560 [Streptomyces sp. NPDC007095]|uniref:hypothetical protein n=1 Tax=Streptomyces sp. NPDC007095 TaxID=3154482 RepID=UPI0033F78450
MKRPGPLLTLLAGLLLAVFMLTLNATTGTKNASSSYQETSPSATPQASPPPTSTSPPSSPPPPSKSAPPNADYAGRTDDNSSAVAVSLRGGKAIAYFCDGRSKESWLKGDVKDDGTMKLTGKHGAELNGTLKGGRSIRGTVDLGGQRYAFTADKAVKPSGLYRATATVRGARLDGGWIVLPGGKQVGILDRDGKPAAAPTIDPETGTVTADGQTLTASPATP